MSLNRLHALTIVGWWLMVLVALTVRLWLGSAPSTSEVLGWLLLGVAPAVILVMVFRGAPEPSVGRTVHGAGRGSPSQAARRQEGSHGPR